MSESLPKWWMLNLTNDERDFFQTLARHPNYAWRSIESLMKDLNWTVEKFAAVAQKHVNSKLVLMKIDKKGQKRMAYWERISHISKSIKRSLTQKRHARPRQNTLGGTPVSTPTTGTGPCTTTPTGGSGSGTPVPGGANPCGTTTPSLYYYNSPFTPDYT